MKKHSAGRRIPCIALFALSLSLHAQTMDPGAYLETSRGAVSLPRVVAAYNQYIDEQDPVFFGIFDVDVSTRPAALDFVDGPINGRFLGIDGFFYARLFRIKEISFRAVFLPSLFAYNLDSSSASVYNYLFGDETLMKWISGYALVGVQARRGLDRVTLGGVLRIEPAIDQGLNQFTYITTAEGVRTDKTFFDRFYADFSLNGWRLDTLVSAEYLEQLAAEKIFDLAARGLRLGPVVEYLGRAASFRPGAAVEWKPVPWFEADIGAKLGIDSDGVGLGEAGIQLGFEQPLVRNIRNSGKDMTLGFQLEGSVCDYNGEIVVGGKAEFSLFHYPFVTWFDMFGLRYLGNITLGVSWNHADTLARMPFEDQVILYIRSGGGYYSRPKQGD